MDGVANTLVMAAEGPSDLVGIHSISASQQDLATAQNEGIWRA
jgi:hypothetical protein